MSDPNKPFYFKGTHDGDEWTLEFLIDWDERTIEGKLYPSIPEEEQSHWIVDMVKKVRGLLRRRKS